MKDNYLDNTHKINSINYNEYCKIFQNSKLFTAKIDVINLSSNNNNNKPNNIDDFSSLHSYDIFYSLANYNNLFHIIMYTGSEAYYNNFSNYEINDNFKSMSSSSIEFESNNLINALVKSMSDYKNLKFSIENTNMFKSLDLNNNNIIAKFIQGDNNCKINLKWKFQLYIIGDTNIKQKIIYKFFFVNMTKIYIQSNSLYDIFDYNIEETIKNNNNYNKAYDINLTDDYLSETKKLDANNCISTTSASNSMPSYKIKSNLNNKKTVKKLKFV